MATGRTLTKRVLVPRPLGGFDRSRQSHVLRAGHYDLLNLRPVRGDLIQTALFGDTEIVITPAWIGTSLDYLLSASETVDSSGSWTGAFDSVP